MSKRRWAAGVVLALVALAGLGVSQAWAPDRSVQALSARWAPAPSRFISVMDMQVHVRDEGPRDDPHPLVLLHGTSASLHTWDGWVSALKAQHRVIRVDMPGFGLTGPNPTNDYRLPTYADFVIAVLNQLGVQQPVVLGGNSFGGEVAWKTAVDHPTRVSRLVLVDSAGYYFEPRSMPIGFKLARMPALKPVMAKLLPRGAIESSVRNVYGDPSKVTTELVDRYYELTLRAGNRAALSERFTQAPTGQYADQVKEVRQPTLILWGAQDQLIPPDNAQRFQRDIPGSRLVMFEGLGHVPHEEDPARTVAAVQSFLAQP
ncbi:MAG: alpha/beta fold hydrolase [Aquabacterium sp.]|uniref:alpha/beta fold hydrolase n=1 Tax=Aquabacterium sp. TaxID=1872578 RepID=UPI003BE2510E